MNSGPELIMLNVNSLITILFSLVIKYVTPNTSFKESDNSKNEL
jgi:hypothetical protein